MHREKLPYFELSYKTPSKCCIKHFQGQQCPVIINKEPVFGVGVERVETFETDT